MKIVLSEQPGHIATIELILMKSTRGNYLYVKTNNSYQLIK
ncbi:hypothetical protein [Mucilaginibacter achroorhodeus]|nr:hypothetical protein [Mucilaginibacter achroorhodeus]